MDAEEYFSTIYVLLCTKQNISPSPQPFFPSSYLPNAIEKASKVRARRTKFYDRVKKLFRLTCDDSGKIDGLECLRFNKKMSAEVDENQNCM
jgi:hypothetical protein